MQELVVVVVVVDITPVVRVQQVKVTMALADLIQLAVVVEQVLVQPIKMVVVVVLG
jgi:hypothetical protein